jgi:formylglycine-generating enzyme required for sulfatase activity
MGAGRQAPQHRPMPLSSRSPWLIAAPLLAAAAPAEFRDCADCPAMATIPAGSGTLGSDAAERARAGIVPLFGDREEPRYRAAFARPFALGRTEITRAQYAAFSAATKHPEGDECGVHDPRTDSWHPRPGFNWRRPGFEQADDHPAVCISHADATAYAEWLAARTGKPYRLPSDAEWEYAARAGSTTPWTWGSAPEAGCGVANLLSAGTVAALGWPKSLANRLVCATERRFTVPVASYPANAWGLHDMIGNAFEWVADCNAPDNRDARPDGAARAAGDCARRYLKGGAFHTPLWLTRPAVRGAPLGRDVRMFAVGFRVARSLPGDAQ